MLKKSRQCNCNIVRRTDTQINGAKESTKIDTHIYGQEFNRGKKVFLANGTGKTGHTCAKINLASHPRMNTTWVTDLNVKPKP